MVNIIYFLIVIYFLISIINLVFLIKSKKYIQGINCLISNVLSFVFSILYFLLMNIFHLDFGLEVIGIYGIFILSFILMIVSIIVFVRKRKKNVFNKDKIDFKSLILSNIFITPFFICLGVLIYEVFILNSSDLVLVYNYQEGIVSSSYETFSITGNKIRKLDTADYNIYKLFYKKYSKLDMKSLSYNCKDDTFSSYYSDFSYNEDLVNYYVKDIKSKYNPLHITIVNFSNNDYYLINVYGDDFSDEIIYKGKKYLGKIDGIGSVHDAYLLEN